MNWASDGANRIGMLFVSTTTYKYMRSHCRWILSQTSQTKIFFFWQALCTFGVPKRKKNRENFIQTTEMDLENAEEILQILERYTKQKSKTIPDELNGYLTHVALTGDSVYTWSKGLHQNHYLAICYRHHLRKLFFESIDSDWMVNKLFIYLNFSCLLFPRETGPRIKGLPWLNTAKWR